MNALYPEFAVEAPWLALLKVGGTADRGGRGGRFAGGCGVEDFNPGGAEYDMMNAVLACEGVVDN